MGPQKLPGLGKYHYLPLALCALTFLIYYQGANGPYVRDDYSNLLENKTLVIQDFNWEAVRTAALSSPATRYRRPVSMLTFAANYSLAGNMHPYSVKVTNILIHIVIGIGIFFLTSSLLTHSHGFNLQNNEDAKLVALLTTAIWLLHPLNVSTVLYTVQRMTMLSTLFSIYACIIYIHCRQRSIEANQYLLVVPAMMVLFTALAFFSKETGALLPGLLLLIETFCFRFLFHPKTKTPYKLCLLAVLIVPTFYVACYLGSVFISHIDQDYSHYFFTVYERAITQPRVLWQYLGWSLFLNPEPMSIIQDDILTSTSVFHPIYTIISMVAWIALAATAALFMKSRHILIFCLLWFLWGHILESTIPALAMIFEHRNYLPSYGIFLGLSAVFVRFFRLLNIHKTIKVTVLFFIFLLYPAYLLQERVSYWQDSKSLVLSLIEKKPDSAYTFVELTNFLDLQGDAKGALAAIRQAQNLEPREAGYIFTEASLHCLYYPEKLFSNVLKNKMHQQARFKKITNYFLRQFQVFVENCGKTKTNEVFLMTLYNDLKNVNHNKLSSVVFYGIGIIHIYNHDYDDAIQSWKSAIARAPGWLPLTPEIDDVRKRYLFKK